MNNTICILVTYPGYTGYINNSQSQFLRSNRMSVRQSARLAGITKSNYRAHSSIPSSRNLHTTTRVRVNFDALAGYMADAPVPAQDLMVPQKRAVVSRASMLKSALVRHGLEKKPVMGDGNCLYHSLTDQINALGQFGEFTHVSMRRHIVTHIYRNMEFYGPFLEDKLIKKLKMGTWGSNVDVSAAADLFNIKITIITFNDDMVILPRHNNEDSVVGSIFLCFQAELHYDSTRKIEY